MSEARSPDERITDALEKIAEELEYQNAVLSEQARAQHLTAVAGSDYADPDEQPTSSPNTRSLLSMIDDQEHERDRADDRGPLRADGSGETADGDDQDPLEDILVDQESLVDEAEQARKQYNEARERLEAVSTRLHETNGELYEQGLLSDEEWSDIERKIENSEYAAARDQMQEAIEADRLEFEDDEKDLFARRFSEAWEEQSAAVEEVRTALLDFSRDLDREDLVNYLYGANSGLNKTDIQTVFDAFEDVSEGGLSTRQMARVLQAFERDLTIEDTVDVLEAIKEAADVQ